MSIEIEKLKAIPEALLFSHSQDGVMEKIVTWLRDNNKNAYTIIEITVEMSRLNITTSFGKPVKKSLISQKMTRLIKEPKFNIKKRGSYYWYEENSKNK